MGAMGGEGVRTDGRTDESNEEQMEGISPG